MPVHAFRLAATDTAESPPAAPFSRLRPWLAALIVAVAFAATDRANAQDGFGMHGGATVDPDQGFFGMHYIKSVSGDLRIHPGADVGFGDGLTLATFHVDLAQWFDISPRWHLFFGGGPAVNVYRFDLGNGSDSDDSSTDVEGGFESMVGFAHESGVSFELRVGSNGSPDLRFSVGYTFK
jgi:hypothetical protein